MCADGGRIIFEAEKDTKKNHAPTRESLSLWALLTSLRTAYQRRLASWITLAFSAG